MNYAEMEKKFKVYIYPDGDPNTFYQTPRKLTGKYASEGYFFQNIRESKFVTDDPDQAHLFFIPISCHKMRGKVLLCFSLMSLSVYTRMFDEFLMILHVNLFEFFVGNWEKANVVRIDLKKEKNKKDSWMMKQLQLHHEG